MDQKAPTGLRRDALLDKLVDLALAKSMPIRRGLAPMRHALPLRA